MHFFKRFLAGTTIASVTVAFAACGGGGGKTVDAEDWVAEVCDLAADFNDESDDLGAELFEIELDKKGAKKDVTSVLDDLAKAQSEFRKGFDKVGTPDLDSGKDVRAAFLKQFDENDKALKKVRDAVKKLDEGDDFEDDLFKAFEDMPETDFRSKLEDIADERKTDDAQEIIDLIDEDPECASVLLSSSGGDEPEPATVTTKETPKASTPAAKTATPRANASKNEKWMGGFCGALQNYGEDVNKLTTGINFGSGSNQQVKDGFVKFLTDLQQRTGQLRDDVKKLGNPDIKDGAKVQSALVDAFSKFVNSFDGVIKDAKALDTANPTKLQNDMQKLSEKFSETLDGLDSTFSDLDTKFDTKELEKIADNTPECAGII